jgi:RNA polymerase sigma factor (TIGR02999 family)
MTEVTQLLNAIDRGDPHAAADLLPLVYDELRRLAAVRLAAEPSGNTLQPTALVHEAYLRLVANPLSLAASPARESREQPQWDHRGHFFAAAAEAMRRILVDAARRKKRLKRGGDHVRQDLEDLNIASPEPREDLLALDEALDKLTSTDRQAAELVKLRYFAGLTLLESAQVMDISSRTADRLWAYARAWLHQELRG